MSQCLFLCWPWLLSPLIALKVLCPCQFVNQAWMNVVFSYLPTSLPSVLFNCEVFWSFPEKQKPFLNILIFSVKHFDNCRHVVLLVTIWAVSGLLSLPEAIVLHAVSTLEDQPCVRWILLLNKSPGLVLQRRGHMGPDQLRPLLELQHRTGLRCLKDTHSLLSSPRPHGRPLL